MLPDGVTMLVRRRPGCSFPDAGDGRCHGPYGRGIAAFPFQRSYSANGCGRTWKRTISLVIPLPPSWCQFVTES